jgi:membrane protease YdiL (CAAX protease family)
MKKTDIEPVLLFTVFFLPGYLAQNSPVNQAMFNDLSFNLYFTLTAAGQIFLLLYVLSLRESRRVREDDYGLRNIALPDVFKALAVSVGAGICILPFLIIPSLLGKEAADAFTNPVAWEISNPAMIGPILITCIATGYREELFFRSYLLTYMKQRNIPAAAAIIASTLLFGLGHVYQGIVGFAGTAVIGLFFALMFVRKRNLHSVALAHGIYNFVTLMVNLR